MSIIDKIVLSTITADTSFPSVAGFGTILLVKEFDTFDTTSPFINNESRHRTYNSIDEVLADGWDSTSDVYAAANRVFAQSPGVGAMTLGRKDSGDAGWPEALTAINDEFSSWYGLCIVEDAGWDLTTRQTNLNAIAGWVQGKNRIFGHASADEGMINITRVASAGYTIGGVAGDIADWAIIADGAFDMSIDGASDVQITTLDFTSGPVTTLAEVATVIDTALTGATCTAVGNRLQITSDTVDSTSSIELKAPSGLGTDIMTDALFNLTLSTTEPGYDVGSVPGTSDLATYFGDKGYNRTYLRYNPQEQDAQHITPVEVEWYAIGLMAENFFYEPASQTWAYKPVVGATPTEVSESQLDFLFDPKGATPRSAGVYTRIKSINIDYKGRMSEGTPIDVIRGADWLNDLIQTLLFADVTRTAPGQRKVPGTNSGIAVAENTLRGALTEASVWFLDGTTIEVNVPDISEISASNRADRILDKITWTARLQGAFEEFIIEGAVTA